MSFHYENPFIDLFKKIQYNKIKLIPFDWFHLSMNPNITTEILNKYPNYPWDITALSMNPNMHIKYVLKNLNKEWDWTFLSINRSIKINDIIEHGNLNWNKFIYKNSNFGEYELKSMLSGKLKFSFPIDWNIVSANQNISWDYICKNNHPWNWEVLSSRNDINVDILLKLEPYYHKLEWGLIRNDVNLCKDILQYDEHKIKSLCSKKVKIYYNDISLYEYLCDYKTWKWDFLSKEVDWNTILKHPDKPWNDRYLSENTTINIKIVKMTNVNWNMPKLTQNPNITIDDMYNVKLNWDTNSISTNPNLTLNRKDIIYNWENISRNKFELHSHIIEQKRKKYKLYTDIILFNDLILDIIQIVKDYI